MKPCVRVGIDQERRNGSVDRESEKSAAEGEQMKRKFSRDYVEIHTPGRRKEFLSTMDLTRDVGYNSVPCNLLQSRSPAPPITTMRSTFTPTRR